MHGGHPTVILRVSAQVLCDCLTRARRASDRDPDLHPHGAHLVATASDSETPQAYDASTTYISFIIENGDNVVYLVSSRRTWLQERVCKCQSVAG